MSNITNPATGGGGGAVASVSNADHSITVSPNTGSVVLSLNVNHANTWGGAQTFSLSSLFITGGTNGYILSTDGNGNISWIANSGGGGSGTVTTVSVASANGISGTVANATTTPAITLTLGAITPTSVNSVVLSGSSTPTLTVTGTSSISGSNTGDQTSVSGNAGTVTIADAGGDTTTWVLLGTSQTGSLAPATDGGLTYNATSHALTATTFIGALSGNASTATVLATTRAINGVNFDGSAPITVTAAAGTLTGTTLNSTVVTSSLTTVGTLSTGVWQGTKVALAYGGTNADLSATGGTSNVLKQASAGAAITVGQLAASDLSNGTSGSGAVLLVTSATLISPLLGTPTSGNLSNCTALPISTGVSGLATGVGTFLATPSSANLLAAMTDKTGTGVLVFGTSPTLTTAVLGSSTATTQTAGDSSSKVATTAFVANAILGQDFKEACKYATTAALPSLVYSNGSSGVGATLTGVGFGALSIDGNTPSVSDRILVKNQVSTFQNGIYTVTTVGGVATLFVLTRAVDFNQSAEIDTGDSVFVSAGTANSTTTWAYNGIDQPVMGTDAITFAQTAGQGSFTSGNGITITGVSIAIDTSVTVDKTTSQTLTNKTLTSPTLTTPTLGVATATTVNKVTLTAPASGSTLTILDGKTFTVNNTITLAGTDAQTYTFPSTSATIARTDAGQTFTGVQTMSSPALTTPAITGIATGTGVATAATVSTLALRDTNGNITMNNAIESYTTTVTAAQTTTLVVGSTYQQFFTGSTAAQILQLPVASTLVNGQSWFVVNASTVTMQINTSGSNNLLVLAAGTSAIVTCINTGGGTGTASWSTLYFGDKVATGKALTVNNSITLSGTDATTMTFPSTSATMARTDAAQTFTGTQTFAQIVTTNNAITATSNAATVPITSRISTVTNSSAATLTITMTTTSAVDGQLVMVRILDFSAVAQTVTWVNTENSSISAPTTSNGSTTLPLTVGFQYNGGTSKWRCIASA